MESLEEVPATDDIKSEVGERLEVFVKTYVSEFEKKLEEYAKEAEVGGIPKTGKLNNTLAAPLSAGASVGAGLIGGVGGIVGKAVGGKAIETGFKYLSGRNHRKKAKKITHIFQTVKSDELRKMLVEAASLIYYSFQTQFESVIDADGNWWRALSKLAIDARNRSISYIYNEETTVAIEALSNDLLTKAVILGESKDSLISHVTPKKMQQIIPGTKPGHTLKNESKEWKTSDIYEKVGIKIVGSNGQTKYYKKKMCGNDYGYRWAFSWENEYSWISTYEEDCGNILEDPRTPLNLEELEVNMDRILTNINKKDPKLQLDRIEGGVDETKETLETMKKVIEDIVPMKQDLNEIKTKFSSELPKSDEPRIFTVREPVKTFTGRERELTQLQDKLQTHQNQVVVSQCASISGLGGMGKSELARKYAHTYHEYYGSCIWIDSETQSSITQSFHRLAEKLQIPIQQKNFGGQRNILLIVEDIYKRFSDSKSLFIFDNVNQYEDIEDFLPSNLSPTDEKPTIIITSRNSDWDIGDEGDVGLILLDQFTPEDALSFVKKVLEIKDEDKSHDSSISELTEELCCFPLALRQAASYIKAKKCLISAIDNYLGEFRVEKSKRDLLQYKTKRDRYTETTYTTWQITFRNIGRNEASGRLAIRLVEVMAYLAADNIPLLSFIKLSENDENLNEAVDILVRYSIITINECYIVCDAKIFEENDKQYHFNGGNTANIHRLVQQVIRLWLREDKREEGVLRTALIKAYHYFYANDAAMLWTYLCNYTTLINKYFCELDRELKPCAHHNVILALGKLVTDGDTRVIRKMLNFFEDRDDLWREISYHFLNKAITKFNNNDLFMKNTGHETDIKALHLFHAEVSNALKHSITTDLELFLQNFDKSLINSWFDQCTALDKSAESGNLNVVKILVENGADVNSPVHFRVSAVHAALINKHPKVVEYLLDHGADSNTINNRGLTVLELASSIGYLNIVKRLVDTKAKCENGTEVNWRPLLVAALNNQVEIVEFLTNHKVYRSAMKDHGQTVCHAAVAGGSIKVVKYLIGNKLANVNGRTLRNETLLFAAANWGQLNVIKYLLSDETHDEVDIDAHNVLGGTPFFQALLRGNVHIARFLFEQGASVDNVQNGNTLLGQLNITALHLAAACNCLEIVKLLVEECNADINMGLNTCFSPLQVAKYFDSKYVCEFLISNGADTSELSEANLQNITRRFRTFCEEKTDIVDFMFFECNAVLDILEYNCKYRFNVSIDALKRFEKLRSFIEKLRLDNFSYRKEENYTVLYREENKKCELDLAALLRQYSQW